MEYVKLPIIWEFKFVNGFALIVNQLNTQINKSKIWCIIQVITFPKNFL